MLEQKLRRYRCRHCEVSGHLVLRGSTGGCLLLTVSLIFVKSHDLRGGRSVGIDRVGRAVIPITF